MSAALCTTKSDGESPDHAGKTEQDAARQQQCCRFAGLIGDLDRGRRRIDDARRDGPAAERQCGRRSQEDEYQNQDYLHFLTRCSLWQMRGASASEKDMCAVLYCKVTSICYPICMTLSGLIAAARVVECGAAPC